MNHYVLVHLPHKDLSKSNFKTQQRKVVITYLMAFLSFLEKMWVFHLAFKNGRKRKTVFRWSVGLVASHLEKYSGACAGAAMQLENFEPFANE